MLRSDKTAKGRSFLALPILAGIGLAYLLFVRITGITIPCVFERITGWECPGCGITTLFYCLSRFDPAGAYRANAFLFVTMPFLLFELAYSYITRTRSKRQKDMQAGSDTDDGSRSEKSRFAKWNNVLLWIYIALLLGWGVYRNVVNHAPFKPYLLLRDLFLHGN